MLHRSGRDWRRIPTYLISFITELLRAESGQVSLFAQAHPLKGDGVPDSRFHLEWLFLPSLLSSLCLTLLLSTWNLRPASAPLSLVLGCHFDQASWRG